MEKHLLRDDKALPFRYRSHFAKARLLPDRKSVAGIMHEVLLAAAKVFLVLWMLRVAVDRNRRCVFHRGLYHDALKIFSFSFLFHKQATLHFFRCRSNFFFL